MASKTKYKNIPSYMNNAKSSFKQIMTSELSSIMPGISSTTVTIKEALGKVKSLDRSDTRKINRYVNTHRRYIFGTVSDFVKNAKEDLSTGKFYNQERADKNFANGLDSMIGNFDDSDDGTVYFNDVETGNKTSQFDKYLKSTAAGSRNSEMIADTISQVNLSTGDYIANVNTLNNTKLITIGIKQHMEQMKSLNNIEKLTGGILKFNQDILAESLENRDKYLESILDETRELKSMIQMQTATSMARFKGSSNDNRSSSQIDRILNSGGTIDIKEYAKIVKGNLKQSVPFPMEFLKTLIGDAVSNPVAKMMGVGFNALLGKDLKNSMKNLDKTLSGAFASYLLKMQKVKTNGNSMIGRLIAELLGVDINKYNKPSLGGYKYKDMTLEIEQMKAKSITEVIPTYLSEITKSLTGIDKVYDYNKGVFIDRKTQRTKYDNELKNNILGDLYDTQDNMRQGLYSIKNLNKNQAKLLEADLDDFLYFIGLIPEAYNDNMSYQYVTKLGLKLRGGEKSYKIIKEIYRSMPNEYKSKARIEHLESLGRRGDMWNTFNNNLQSSGASAVYNKFSDHRTGKRVFKRNGRTYTVDDNDLHINPDELDNLDIVQIKDALSKGYITKEEARRASNNINNRNPNDRKSASELAFEEVNTRAKNLKGKFKFNNPIRSVTDKLNTYINGLDAAINSIFYVDSDDKRSLYDRLKDFGKDIYKTNKNLIFGKDGFIPDKYAGSIKKYGKGGLAGGGIGATVGQIIGKPILGSVVGAVGGMLAETEKVKTVLWGDGINKKGILGSLVSEINKHVMEPLKGWFRSKFGDKADKLFDSIKTSFGKNFGKGNKTGEKVFGTIEDIFSTNDRVRGEGGSTLDNTMVELVQDMERGIYSNQLDMIIYLLSNGNLRGRGVKIKGGTPNSSGGGAAGIPGQTNRNIPGLNRNKYYRVAGYDIPAQNVDQHIPGLNRNKYYRRVNRANTVYPYQVPSPYIIGNTGGTKSDYSNIFSQDLFRQNAENWMRYNNRQTINNELSIVTPGDIVVHSAESYLRRDKEYVKYVKNMAQKAKEAARDAKSSINQRFKETRSGGKNGESPFTLETVINKVKGPAKKWFNGTLLKRGIGKGQGSLIGMALGSILLGNPLLGAVAGATFAGRNDQQKEINASLPKQAVLGTSLKYGAIAAMLGINPMYGILLGSLFPQNKGKKENKPLKIFGKEIKMNKMMKGALAGGLIGNVPGAVIGGLIGHGLDKRDHRNDWKYNEDGTKKTPEEIRDYKQMMRQQKAEKDAKGKLFDKLTGGGKFRGIATGALGGLLGFGPMGILTGGLAGALGSTSQNKLNRNNTQGILNKMGLNKWQSAVIGSIVANTLLLGPLGALGAGALAPLIGGSLGLLLSKGKDKRFWRYDENGELLSKGDRRRSYQKFKHDVMYDENGERRSASESVKFARNKVKEENEYRDKVAKEKGEGEKKNFDPKQLAENAKKLEFLEVGKGKGTLGGAQLAAAAGVNPLLGAGIGFLVSKKKRVPPKGFSDDPIYVRIKGNDPKSAEGRQELKERIKQKLLGKANDRKSIINSRNLMTDFKTDTNALLKTGANSAQGLILRDINGSTTPDKVDNLYKRATFLSSFKNAGGLTNAISTVADGKEKKGLLSTLMNFLKTKGAGTIAKILAALAGGKGIKEVLKMLWNSIKQKGRQGLNNMSDGLTLAQGGDAIKNFIQGNENARNENYNSASANYSKGSFRTAQFGTGMAAKVLRGINLGRAKYLTATATKIDDVTKFAGAAMNYSEKAGFISTGVSKLTEKIWKILDAIAKKFPSLASKINDHKAQIAKKVASETLEQGTKKGLLHVLEKASVVIAVAQAVYDFSTGMYETNNLIGVTADYAPTTTARICSGLSKALSNFLIIVPKQFVFNIIYGIINKDEYQNIKKSRSQSESNYKEFVNANPGTDLTYEQYKKITNPTAWSKMTGWITGNKDKNIERYVTNSSYEIPDYIKNNTTKDSEIASTYNTKDRKTEKQDGINFNVLQSIPGLIQGSMSGGGILGLPFFISLIDKKINDAKNKKDEQNKSDQSNSGSGYVIQDNSVTYNVHAPTSYDTSNNNSGGRGPASSGYTYLKNKVRNNIVTTSTENKSPVQTFLKVADNDSMSYMLNSAVANGATFLNDVKTNNKIRNNANNKGNAISARKNGYNIVTNMASNIVDKTKKFGTKIWEGAKAVGSSLVSGAKKVSSKVFNGIRNAGSRAIDSVKSIFSGGRGEDPDYYNQQDSRWSNMSFGIYNNKRDTVGDGGCGPTTAATVIQKLTGRKVTPAETSKYALQRGYKLDNGGTTPDYFSDIGAKYGVNMSQDSATSNNTINNLRRGKPVIFLGHDKTGTSPFGNDSHYVIGTKMDAKGNVQVLDPKNRENNHTYNIKDLAMNATDAIVANGGRGKPVYKKRSSYSRSNNRTNDKRFIFPGRGVSDININETNFTWNSPLSKRSSTDYIVLHHAEAKTCSVEQIDSWHKSNGWAGIGYHFLVRKDGSIYRGRPLWSIGAHVQGKNSNSIGICAEGNFMKESMSETQKMAIARLINYLKTMYPNAKIVGHKEIGNSNCPGTNYPLNELKNYTKLLSKDESKKFKSKKNIFDIKKTKKTLFGGRGSGFNIIESNLDWNGTLEERSSTQYIALHHAQAKKCSVEDIHSWHKENGWAGIGYHFLVRKDGSIYRGRPIDSLGAHVQGMNDCSLGICAEGDFTSETMSSTQKKSIAKLIYYLKGIYPEAKIVGHKEIGSSDCPGSNYPLSEMKNYTKLLTKEEMAAIDKMPKNAKSSGKSSGSNWLKVAKQVKEAIAAQKPTYGGSVSISVNGKSFSVRCDCSGYVSACLYACGVRKSSEPTYTGDMVSQNGSMKETGFTFKKWSGWDSLTPGDIVVRDSKGSAHTEIFVRNEGGKHYVYNCGSTKSVQSPGETVSAGGDYEVVWQPTGSLESGSADGSSSGSSGSSGKKNMLNIMSDWFDKMTDSVNNPLKNVKKVINKSYITPKENNMTPLVQNEYSDGSKGIIHREIPALANAKKDTNKDSSSSNNNGSNKSKGLSVSNGIFNKRFGGRGVMMGFNDVQNKGGMFGFNSYLNTITESIDGSANGSSSSNNNSNSSSSNGSFNGDLSGSVPSDDLGKKVTVDQALNRNAKSFSKVTAQQLKEAIDKGACKKGSWLSTQVDGIMKAAQATGIDPRFIAAKAAGEIGWDGSKISRDKHNMFGINATDNNPYGNAYSYANDEEGWVEGAKWFAKNYIDAGQNSFYKMKNPTAAGQPAWHSYQTGDITPKAQIYANMINATGGAGYGGRGSLTDKLYNRFASRSRKHSGRGVMMGFNDVQNKGGMFGFNSYLNTITESIDGSSASTNTDNSNSSSSNGSSSSGGSPSNGKGAMGSGDSYRNSTFGKTSRCQNITVPSGLGTVYTYERWQGIKYYNAGKLKTESGMNFDSEGFGKIGDRFVVAMTSTFGVDGDYVNIKLTNGQTLYAVIGDEKDQTTAHGADCANKWGHNSGKNIVEFIVDGNSWYSGGQGSHANVGQEGFHSEMANVGVVSVENIGGYWGKSGDGGRGSSKISTKLSKLLPSRSHRTDTRKASVTVPTLSSPVRYNTSNAGMAPIPSTNSVSRAIADKNYRSTINDIDQLDDMIRNNISVNADTGVNSENQTELAMLEVLKSIAGTLERIEKNASMNSQNNIYALPYGNNQMRYNPNTYKNDMMRSIVTGR